jgi:hypothetical protein
MSTKRLIVFCYVASIIIWELIYLIINRKDLNGLKWRKIIYYPLITGIFLFIITKIGYWIIYREF